MADLRTAAQQALEALENCSSEYGHRCNRCDSEVDEGGKVASALRAALAQVETVQSAARVDAYDMIDRFLRNNLRDDDYAEYSAALDSLYTAPPKRKPLTEEEKRALADKFLSCQPESYEVSGVFDLISAVERAHGIGKESGDER